jgi:SAM-dependent methyltransferase
MPTNPNVLERLLLFRLNRGPAPMLDLFGAASFEALTLALDMGLIDALDREGLTLDEIAARFDADENGIRILLDFLAAQGYVVEREGRYRNTAMTTKWLTTGSETNLAPWLSFWNELVLPFWERHLERAVLDGKPPMTIYEWFDEEPTRWETAQDGFRAAAAVVVDDITERVDVPDNASTLLDVGGGHGLYAIELCRAYPGLTATVFDNPDALEAARREITAAEVEDRVATSAGDYWTDDLGSGYDIALVFNVIHAHDDAENRRLLGRVREALRPGGRIAILDQLEGSARMPVGKSFLGFGALTYLSTLGAKTHPYEDVDEWLRSTGFENVTRSPIRLGGPGSTLVQATRAG